MKVLSNSLPVGLLSSCVGFNMQQRHFPQHIFFILCLAYFTLASLRKAVSVAMPWMITELNLTKHDVGMVSSGFSTAFGISKFIGSIASDHISSRILLCCTIFLSGCCAIWFGISSLPYMFAISWTIHGLAQGVGWPAISTLIYGHFSEGYRGTVWSIVTSVSIYFYLPTFLTMYIIGW
jgi:sugar phosphate permease